MRAKKVAIWLDSRLLWRAPSDVPRKGVIRPHYFPSHRVNDKFVAMRAKTVAIWPDSRLSWRAPSDVPVERSHQASSFPQSPCQCRCALRRLRKKMFHGAPGFLIWCFLITHPASLPLYRPGDGRGCGAPSRWGWSGLHVANAVAGRAVSKAQG